MLAALAVADDIEVDGSLTGMPMITLRPGASLRGGGTELASGGGAVGDEVVASQVTGH